ncbi:hypothetical protein B7463_g2776, partial [Scytalidium lignicola]
MPPRRRKPKFKITWWMRIRNYLRHLQTPLRIRDSIDRLRYSHQYPYLRLFYLLLPFPSWHFPLLQPPAPREITKNVGLFYRRHPNLDDLRCIPLWRARDTPLRAVYHLYEILLTGEYTLLRGETEYFWYQSGKRWALHLIPDPQDTNPIRYAVLASIVEELVLAFNWRLKLGLRRDHHHESPPFTPEMLPSWSQSVPPVTADMLNDLPSSMLDGHGNLVLDEVEGGSERFAKRNIITDAGWFYTV